MLISKRQSELNDLKEVDVASQSLVVVVGRSPEVPNRSGNDSREFGVLIRLGVRGIFDGTSSSQCILQFHMYPPTCLHQGEAGISSAGICIETTDSPWKCTGTGQ